MFARIGFSLGAEEFAVEAPVPEGLGSVDDVLPTAFALAGAVAERGVARAGAPVSCRQGCGACCRQVVPISQPEARHLARVVEGLPEPRRTAVRERFRVAVEILERGDWLARFASAGALDDTGRQQLAIDYFRLGIACPFLENEECSIYADRPLVCREYLVTTPAANCARPGSAVVTRVGLAGRVSVAMGQMEPRTRERDAWWMPLVLALRWSAGSEVQARRAPGTDLVRALVEWMKRTAS